MTAPTHPKFIVRNAINPKFVLALHGVACWTPERSKAIIFYSEADAKNMAGGYTCGAIVERVA